MASQTSSLHIRQSLKNMGFSDNEIKIMTFLLYEKKSTAREISRQTAISFSSVQYALSNLSTRGIVTCLPGHEDSFEVCSEKDFFSWIEEQKHTNQGIYEKAKKDIHDFISIVEGSSWKPEVLYYEGREGIIELYEDMLETAGNADKNIYSWLDIEKTYQFAGKEYAQSYIKKRIEKSITSHDIVPKNQINLEHLEKREKREMKFVDELPINGDIRIYGDKVACITFDKEVPVGFVFQGKLMTNLFRTIFDNTWKLIDEKKK